MAKLDQPGLELALRRLAGFAALSEDETSTLQTARLEPRRHWVGAELTEGRHVLLLAGWACRCRILPDGRRQIFNFILPGDSIDLSRPDLFMTETLTRAETVDLGEALAPGGRTGPSHDGLQRALAEADRAEYRRQLDHMVRVGSMPAYEATADLLMEFHDRLAAVGLAADGRFPLPVFQDVLGSALGLSPAHTSRVFTRLRREGLLELKSGWVTLLAPLRMRAMIRSFRGPAQNAKERASERRVREVDEREAAPRGGAGPGERERNFRAC